MEAKYAVAVNANDYRVRGIDAARPTQQELKRNFLTDFGLVGRAARDGRCFQRVRQ